MNTKKIFSSRFRNMFGIVIAILLHSSCSKDELLPATPSGTSERTPAVTPIQQAVAEPANLPYEAIKINHIAGRGYLPDYEVTVYSNMRVLFDGRANTSFIGKKSFAIDPKIYYMVKSMFISSHLFDVAVDQANINSGIADLPEVLTSFNDGMHTVTLTDYNDPNSHPQLYHLRTTAETNLGISDLILDSSTQDRK